MYIYIHTYIYIYIYIYVYIYIIIYTYYMLLCHHDSFYLQSHLTIYTFSNLSNFVN